MSSEDRGRAISLMRQVLDHIVVSFRWVFDVSPRGKSMGRTGMSLEQQEQHPED